MRNRLLIFFVITISQFLLVAQVKDTIEFKPQNILFANIYTKFYATKYDGGQKVGFLFHTGLLGYMKQISKNVKGTIIFDVTRTTNAISITDSNNKLLNVSYFEGSKYTAYLKMAEIEWQFAKSLYFKAGQLLSTQYLTFIDKYWEHRYVEVTMQELYRFGNPADFGVQFSYVKPQKITCELGVFNGEGPFRHQDANSNFLVSANLQVNIIKPIVFKIYAARHFAGVDTLNNKDFLSVFAGWKNSSFTIASEFSIVNNADFVNQRWFGASFFAFYNVNTFWQLFYRFDYVKKSATYSNNALHIVGVQLKPTESFFLSINYQNNRYLNENSIFLAIGLKF